MNLESSLRKTSDNLDYNFWTKTKNFVLDSYTGECQNGGYFKSAKNYKMNGSLDVTREINTNEKSSNVDLEHISNQKFLVKTQTDKKYLVHTKDKNKKDYLADDVPTASIPIKCSDQQTSIEQLRTTHTTKGLAYTWDPVTKRQTCKNIYFKPVKIINLGRFNIGNGPKIDPNNSTTIFIFFRANKKVLHYMGYNYSRTSSQIRYICSEMILCPAELRLRKKEEVAVIGTHTCRCSPLIDLINDFTEINDNKYNDGKNYELESEKNVMLNTSNSSLMDPSKDKYYWGGDIKSPTLKQNLKVKIISVTMKTPSNHHRHQHTGTVIKQEEDIDITEDNGDIDKWVDESQLKTENAENPVIMNDINKDISYVKVESPGNGVNDQVFINTVLNEETQSHDEDRACLFQDFRNNGSDDTCELEKKNKSISRVDNLDSSNLIFHYDVHIVGYKGYKYVKEYSGKYAWCKNSKICSGMIKILPDNTGKLIGEHSCNTFNQNKVIDYGAYDNDSTEKTVHVEIKTVSNIPVPFEDQDIFEKSSFGNGLEFKGYKYRKYWENSDISMFVCLYKYTGECSGMVRMQQDKVVQYSDHICNGVENLTFPEAQGNHNIVIIYLNQLISEAEAMYKCFIYRRISRTNHISIWQCAKTESNCKAGIKIYTFTSTLFEDGKHTCTTVTSKESIISKKEIIFSVVSWKERRKASQEKALKKYALPLYANKLIIPVYNNKQELNIIYHGYIYQGDGENLTCIQLRSKGCKGLLHILDGNVMYVSKHDCLKFENNSLAPNSIIPLRNKYSTYIEFLRNVPMTSHITRNDIYQDKEKTEDLHIFRGVSKGEFAMYEGYIYKKVCTYKYYNAVYRWNCTNFMINNCEGVLTTKKYKVLMTSQHSCRNDEYYGDQETKQNKIDRSDSDPLVVDTFKKTCKDLTDIITNSTGKIKYVGDYCNSIGEAIPTKKIKKNGTSTKLKRKKSVLSEEKVETQTPAATVEKMEGHLNMESIELKVEDQKQNEKEVRTFIDNFEIIKGLHEDEDSRRSVYENIDEYHECMETIDKNFLCDKSSKLLEINSENNDYKPRIKFEILPEDKEREKFQSKMEIAVRNFHSNEDSKQVELCSINDAHKPSASMVKEENFGWDIDSGDENIPMIESRGPNGEYFVHFGNIAEVECFNSL